MGIVCGRDRFGLPYSYPVQDLMGPGASRPPTLTLQVYLVTDQNFKVPYPTGETTGAGESAATGAETSDSGLKDPDAPCPGSDGSSSTERGKASNGQEQNGSRADGSDDDESTRSDTSATLPKPILRFLEWLFSGPL